MTHSLKHKIKLMKWLRFKERPAWIMANSDTLRGYLILRMRGYKPHRTLFGKVLRKELS